MKVLRNINNNIAVCLDSKGREVIAFGKGIGFVKPPQDIPLSRIDRTFYNVKDIDSGLLAAIPEEVLALAVRIMDMAGEELGGEFSPNAAITLADHIDFVVRRYNQHISLEMPVQEDIRQLYPKEMLIANKALAMIRSELGHELPKNEAGTLALHFVSARETAPDSSVDDNERMVEECLTLIEEEFGIRIERDEFNCSRFVTHLSYLLKRVADNEQITSSNREVFLALSEKYPRARGCVNKIALLLGQELEIILSDEEQLYLILHVNRLCSRELPNQRS